MITYVELLFVQIVDNSLMHMCMVKWYYSFPISSVSFSCDLIPKACAACLPLLSR
jgi:hypothetical protein